MLTDWAVLGDFVGVDEVYTLEVPETGVGVVSVTVLEERLEDSLEVSA